MCFIIVHPIFRPSNRRNLKFRIYSGQLLPADIAAAQIVGPNVLLTANVSLAVSQGSGSLILSWPLAASGFVLESSPGLDASSVWTTVNIGPTVIGNSNQVIVEPTNFAKYFRLRR